MTDIVERLRAGEACSEISSEYACAVKSAASGCQCAMAADEIERLRAALLDGVCMLSEMGLDPREKCEMAYDHLSAALAQEKQDVDG
jgi:hypothetical protein